jgi:hypothetical protein
MMKRTYFLLLCFVLIWSCIPIVDKISPTIQDFNNFRLTYHVQDTILLFMTYRDNDRLDSVTININRQVPPASNLWRYFSKRSIKGRRFEDTIRIPIPRNAATGIYDLEVKLLDFSKLQSFPKDTIFELLGDNRAPFVSNLFVTNTGGGNIPQTDALGRFITCRSSVIRFSGLAIDNILVREVRASLTDITVAPAVNLLNTARVVTGDTIRLANLFDNDIRIPSTIANGRTLQLTVTALDGEGNQSTAQRVNFVVNCDDQAPNFAVVRTSPQIAPNREVGVIEGSNFRFLDATATDDSGLGLLTITFNQVNQTRNTVFQRNLNGTKSIDIDSLLALSPNLFQLPANALSGAIYELVVTVRDQAGNTIQPFQILITVIRDEPPFVFVANTYVDNVEVRLRPIASISTGGDIILNQIGRGQVLQIEGKIEEDRALEYVRIAWGPTGQETQIVDLKGTDITLPFDFADARSINRFRVPDTRNVDTYTLIIRVKDLKNAEVVIRYVFRVI